MLLLAAPGAVGVLLTSPVAGEPRTEWLPLFAVGVLMTGVVTGGLEEPG